LRKKIKSACLKLKRRVHVFSLIMTSVSPERVNEQKRWSRALHWPIKFTEAHKKISPYTLGEHTRHLKITLGASISRQLCFSSHSVHALMPRAAEEQSCTQQSLRVHRQKIQPHRSTRFAYFGQNYKNHSSVAAEAYI
jgi:hypothetical protein